MEMGGDGKMIKNGREIEGNGDERGWEKDGRQKGKGKEKEWRLERE